MRVVSFLELLLIVGCRSPYQDPASITMISLRRTPCFGHCPIYDLELTRAGAATYTGLRWAKMAGRYRARIDSAAFARLAKTFVDLSFFSLDTAYDMPATDQATTFLCVRTAETRCIRRYGRAGPETLYQMENAVDAVTGRLSWMQDEEH